MRPHKLSETVATGPAFIALVQPDDGSSSHAKCNYARNRAGGGGAGRSIAASSSSAWGYLHIIVPEDTLAGVVAPSPLGVRRDVASVDATLQLKNEAYLCETKRS
jgi:hypothetical protein